jgi:hypothetical protein
VTYNERTTLGKWVRLRSYFPVIHVITEYSDKLWKLWIIYSILDTKISEESVFKLVQTMKNDVRKMSAFTVIFSFHWKRRCLFHQIVRKYLT